MTRIKISQIDTSLAFGFYVPDYDGFVELVDYLLTGERESLEWILGLQPHLLEPALWQEGFEAISDHPSHLL
jgi:hypothetical protein